MKRKRKQQDASSAQKRPRIETSAIDHPTSPLLRQYYPHVTTLRQYLASRLVELTKKRRRKLLQYGSHAGAATDDSSVTWLLDKIVVGSFHATDVSDLDSIDEDITVFTQQLAGSDATITPTQGAFKQSEVVDLVIWRLFRRQNANRRPSHILCQGFQRTTATADGVELEIVPGIPGVFTSCRNEHVEELKKQPWTSIPALLGRKAENVICDMLTGCGLFVPIEGSSNLSQISGVPMSELKVESGQVRAVHPASGVLVSRKNPGPTSEERGHSDVRIVRSRMLYARPSTSKSGRPSAGLPYMHVLNRLRSLEKDEETTHVMKYIFPRQFGLHNAFASEIDPRDTAQSFKDYTLREREIAKKDFGLRQQLLDKGKQSSRITPPPLPKRLRGEVIALVRRIRKRHARCPFNALLQHYCPTGVVTGMADGSIHHATPVAHVSSFCRAVILRILPADFLGSRDVLDHNRKVLLAKIDHFVRMRRHESTSVHDILDGVKIAGVQWLVPPSVNAESKISKTDFVKRRELMAELVYYIFDSLLIPLIRGTFYVTESNVNRNQLFYFRHDVWLTISQPALSTLKAGMLEECSANAVRNVLSTRALGVSRVRLLPKEQGMRPIINLRRRVQGMKNGQAVLGKSINSILTPAFSVLNYEKEARPQLLGSALFSVDDIFPRLQAFRTNLRQQGLAGQPLYFAKVDVQACFDTIPQKRLMTLARRVIATDGYNIARYARAKLVGGHNEETPGFGAKPSWKFLTKAAPNRDPFHFAEEVSADTNEGRNRTVYVDGVVRRPESRAVVLNLLEEHVQANLIRIGKRFYRQKEGIPQGSIVSSLLCSYIYAELEREALGFLDNGHTLLLRLIDDFLVISTDRSIAERFMQIMHAGIPEYGVQVKAAKSRANFNTSIAGQSIARLPEAADFPYCGNAINTVTLDLTKDHERRRQSNVADSVTVEFSKLAGQSFYRKTLNALKLQMHAMLLSTAYNSLHTVLANLYHGFCEVAQKTYHYVRSLPLAKQPGDRLLIRTLDDLMKLATVLMKRRKRTKKDVLPYECAVTVAQARWLACTAFCTVFQRRQTKFRGLIAWLEAQLRVPGLEAQRKLLEPVARAYR